MAGIQDFLIDAGFNAADKQLLLQFLVPDDSQSYSTGTLIGELSNPESVIPVYLGLGIPPVQAGMVNPEQLEKNDLTDLNVDYTKKDLEDVQSSSDVRLEDLGRDVPEFPKHAGIRTTAEDPAEAEVELIQDVFIEGKVLPKGTILKVIKPSHQ
jgi:hypothetical protein